MAAAATRNERAYAHVVSRCEKSRIGRSSPASDKVLGVGHQRAGEDERTPDRPECSTGDVRGAIVHRGEIRCTALTRRSSRVANAVRWVNFTGYARRRTGDPRGPRAQPEGRHRPAAAERARLHHRPLRLGEVEPRVRHDLRRRAAAVRGKPLRVRPSVPADDGEARRRLDRRAEPGDLADRPEDDVAQPALDGGHGDRDLRLPPPAVRAGGPAALPGSRAADRRPEPRPDRGADPRAPGGTRSSPSTRPSSATAKGSSRTCSRSCDAMASLA